MIINNGINISFSQDERFIYTIQNHVSKGPSYLTKWNVDCDKDKSHNNSILD